MRADIGRDVWPRYGGCSPAAGGWVVRSLGLVYPGGVREKRRQPARSGGAGASVRVGRKGCWVQGDGSEAA